MKRWLIDHILPAIVMGVVAAAVHTYIEVQMLRHDVDRHEAALTSMRSEMSDMWAQGSDNVQALDAEIRHRK